MFAPVRHGPEAARRDLGTHRLALGCVVVVLVANALIVAPAATLLRGDVMSGRSFVVAALATDVPMLLVLYGRLIASGATTWHELGLHPMPLARIVRVGAATGLGGLALTVLVGLLLSQLGLRQNQLEQFAFLRGEGPESLAMVLLLGSVVAPFVEELFFRGFVFGMYLRRKPRVVAYATSSLLFALLHVNPRSMDVMQGAALVVGVFALGTLLAWTYERTGSLYPGMVAHGLNNAIALTTVYAAGLG